ncbi:two-component system response regulator YesN [Paenibacillus phyllosphaerae]|uniref:Two-component system response regulator YesN n=1 Tax=Paenibacillus phyllosphaerae TaxID=274593 RepID=A0A7W5AZ14_9BACL|nr:response regulator transcription factor [Paenibacillus phyllosphaerae]MBB3111069.1 two-component system response regulator YesN [Paenibacillus phyllosphaerae]
MLKVMLVDDEPYVRKGLCSLIDWEACGYVVAAEADNGEDAWAIIRAERPDLVITDIRMPVLDGLELIRLVKEELPDTAFIIVSGYNDFSYAQQACRYGVHEFILKPIDQDELTEILLRVGQKIEGAIGQRTEQIERGNQRMIESLIRGEADSHQTAEWAAAAGLDSSRGARYVFVELNDRLLTLTGQDTITASGEERNLIALTIQDSLGLKRPPYLYEHHGRYGFIAGSDLTAWNGDIEWYVRKLQANLSERLGQTVFVYAGKQVAQLIDLKESYISAKETLTYKFQADQAKTVTYERIQSQSLAYTHLDESLFKAWLLRLEERDREGLATAGDAIFQSFAEQRFAPEAVKAAIHQCVLGAASIIKRMGGDERTLPTLPVIAQWQDQNVTLGALRQLFGQFGNEAAECLGALRQDQGRGNIQKVKAYVDAHYASNSISLKSIAAAFFVNSVYLGQLFKKTYGVYFNDYVLRLRIDEAKRLLRQTDCRIYEIAERVGFSNSDYFVTQFEKLEQMTPSEYRATLLR